VSDEPDKESKTETPSEKKISEAVEKGNTPFSRELVSLGSLLAIVAVLTLTISKSASSLTQTLRIGFASIEQSTLQTPSEAALLLAGVMKNVLTVLVPVLILFAVGGVAGSLIQNIPSASWDRVAPKMSRLSPASNLKRIIGKEATVEFLKTGAKFIALCILIYVVLKGKINDLVNIGLGDPAAIPHSLQQTALDIATPTTLFILLLSIGDTVWTRIKWWNDLKMTRQEQKDEHKNAEGDPHLKQKRRMIAQRRLKTGMMGDVPKATLVVVNPTHFAIAMRYVPEDGGAPVVLAKGLDLVALKIKEISKENEIPVVENKPLARSLYRSCEVGDMIPPEYYKAVAEVIHFIERKRQLASGAGAKGSSI
jgi:flagellar biosynthesis protein FlhB